MAVYECIVIVFMISLCWSNELHPATKTAEILDDSRLSISQEQSCPTWYQETEYNGVIRCVCGVTLDGAIVCNYTTQETLISAGYCMSYNDTTNDTVAGGCPFSNPHVGAQIFLVTLPNDTSELNSFMCIVCVLCIFAFTHSCTPAVGLVDVGMLRCDPPTRQLW